MALADTQATNSHGHHTLAKIALVKLRSLLESENIDVGETIHPIREVRRIHISTVGAEDGIRTHDPLLGKEMLYH